MEAREVLFHQYAADHRVCLFGEVSPQLMEFFGQLRGSCTSVSLLDGAQANTSRQLTADDIAQGAAVCGAWAGTLSAASPQARGCSVASSSASPIHGATTALRSRAFVRQRIRVLCGARRDIEANALAEPDPSGCGVPARKHSLGHWTRARTPCAPPPGAFQRNRRILAFILRDVRVNAGRPR